MILDTINAKLATAAALARATDEKVAAEHDTRTAQVASLQDRVFALERDRDNMGTELVHKQSLIDQLGSRVDALVASLVQLGVNPEV